MEKLAQAVEGAIGRASPQEELNLAAKCWATHCLDTYVGELLRRGLDISLALAQFTAAVERENAKTWGS